uniref:Beta-lactamase-related domain-containing protein n=1 Tax=Alexandrium catenella TaxID=2925 RepID=A0A7S1QZR0_ALECA
MSSGGGGLVSTMHDYARFCQCIADGGELGGARLLSVKTVEWMAANHLQGGVDIDELRKSLPESYTEAQGPGTGFGLGFSVRGDAVSAGLIGSVGSAGWGGAANTYFWIDPQERLFVIWMTQVLFYNELKTPVRSKLQSLVYGTIVDRLPFQPLASKL